jgi:hypothetical protein
MLFHYTRTPYQKPPELNPSEVEVEVKVTLRFGKPKPTPSQLALKRGKFNKSFPQSMREKAALAVVLEESEEDWGKHMISLDSILEDEMVSFGRLEFSRRYGHESDIDYDGNASEAFWAMEGLSHAGFCECLPVVSQRRMREVGSNYV